MERYEAYKDSSVEWIGDMPSTWACANLGSIAKQRKNLNKDGNCENVLSLSYGTVKRRVMDNTGLLPESFSTYNVIENGDVVLRLTDLQNDQRSLRVGLCHEQGIITAAYTTLVPNSIDARYLFYSLAVFDYWKGFYGLAGGVRQSLTFDGIRSLRFPLPSQREQRAIADYLDVKTADIDALIADCEREVELLQEYRKAVISEAVTKGLDPDAPMKDSGIEWIGEIPETWKCCRVKQVASISSGATPNRDNYAYWNGTIPWIKTGELRNTLIEESEEFITENALDETSCQLYPAGTILMAMYGQGKTRGMTGMLAMASTTNQACAAIRVNSADNPSYIWKALMAGYDAIRDVALGSGQPNLNADLVSNFHIPLPSSFDEQNSIVLHLNAKTVEIDSLIDAKQSMADKLREYRRSLISEAVTGKFKVTGVE